MRVILLLALGIAAVAAIPKNPQRIVGGTVTTIEEYPTIAALLHSASLIIFWQTCGGTILNNRSILTAAHCTYNTAAISWRVRVGSTSANSGGIVHNCQSILNHPSFSDRTLDNDVAIMRLESTINFNNQARAASISGPNYNLADNQVVWAAGWGVTLASESVIDVLRHVQIWTVNQDVCAQRYATVGSTITDNMLCSGWLDVGGRDQCQGDSGGPLYHNGVVVGVCSWGRGCGNPFFPGVNARVSRFTSWITSNA